MKKIGKIKKILDDYFILGLQFAYKNSRRPCMMQSNVYMNSIRSSLTDNWCRDSVVSGANMPACNLVTGRSEFLLEIKYILALSQHFFFNLRE